MWVITIFSVAETSGSSPLSCGRFERSLESPGKLTTWSNLGSKSPSSYQQSPPTPVIWQSRNREELNNNGDNESRKTKSLPEFECQQAAQAPQDPYWGIGHFVTIVDFVTAQIDFAGAIYGD